MAKAKAQAEAIRIVSEALKGSNAAEAAKLSIARDVRYALFVLHHVN